MCVCVCAHQHTEITSPVLDKLSLGCVFSDSPELLLVDRMWESWSSVRTAKEGRYLGSKVPHKASY